MDLTVADFCVLATFSYTTGIIFYLAG